MFGSEPAELGPFALALSVCLSFFSVRALLPDAAGDEPGASAEPVRIGVPPSLQRRTATIEPSGVVWVGALDRYLVVSDDTGDAANHHQPWVLAMSRAGVFDEEPVPILGVSELNDAEAICAGPRGVFFLVTSHSPNRRNHEKFARRMLLSLELAGRALRVTGELDLTTARDADGGGSLLELAGLPADGRLDIEAITYREGALLIGLKSPLTARDGAVILRLASPVAALRAGKLPPGSVTRLWEVALYVKKHHVPQGVADMLSLSDGSLMLLANSPKGREKDGGGALYHFEPGDGEPRLLRRFKGLHPEGVTLSADGKDLVLVFDANREPPLWMHWPLPARSTTGATMQGKMQGKE
jgi:hypothetical protein